MANDLNQRNLQNAQRFATLTTAPDESGAYATAQICFSDIEKYDNFPIVMQYGFESVPVVGARCIVDNRNGDVNQGVATSFIDPRYRPRNMPAGASCVYDSGGNYIIVNPNGVIDVVTSSTVNVTAPIVNIMASNHITLNTPLVHITGNLAVDGTIDANMDIQTDADVIAGNISLKSHVHGDVETGNSETSSPLP